MAGRRRSAVWSPPRPDCSSAVCPSSSPSPRWSCRASAGMPRTSPNASRPGRRRAGVLPLPDPARILASRGGRAMGIVDDLQRARRAYEQRDWAVAYDRLSAAETAPDEQAATALGADDLMALGTAAYLVGDVDACIRALQRGYRLQVDSGNIL